MCKPLNDLTPEHAFGSGEARVPDHNAIRPVFSLWRSRDSAGARCSSQKYRIHEPTSAVSKLSNHAIYGSSFHGASVARGLFPRFNKSPDAVIKCDTMLVPNEKLCFMIEHLFLSLSSSIIFLIVSCIVLYCCILLYGSTMTNARSIIFFDIKYLVLHFPIRSFVSK